MIHAAFSMAGDSRSRAHTRSSTTRKSGPAYRSTSSSDAQRKFQETRAKNAARRSVTKVRSGHRRGPDPRCLLPPTGQHVEWVLSSRSRTVAVPRRSPTHAPAPSRQPLNRRPSPDPSCGHAADQANAHLCRRLHRCALRKALPPNGGMISSAGGTVATLCPLACSSRRCAGRWHEPLAR